MLKTGRAMACGPNPQVLSCSRDDTSPLGVLTFNGISFHSRFHPHLSEAWFNVVEAPSTIMAFVLLPW